MTCCTCKTGPGFSTPLAAFNSGVKEKLAYLPVTTATQTAPDYVATVDLDESSPTYSTVIHRLFLGVGDELHHSGWNACSSCFGDASASRKHLILPSLKSSSIYAVDVATNPREPRLALKLEGKELTAQTGLSVPHSSHCLGDGTILVSTMGAADGLDAKGNFVVLDQNLKVKGKWTETDTQYGYDMWMQPSQNVMVSSGWGAPGAFLGGFNPADVPTRYASELHVWAWKERRLIQTLPLGEAGLIPLETRFLHNPDATTGFVGCALSSNLIRFWKGGDGDYHTEVAVAQPWAPVTGWALPSMPPLISDILISLDDKYLYLSNWLRGDVNQIDISDPAHPRIVSRIWLGGSMRAGGSVSVTGGEWEGKQPSTPPLRGVELQGGPQMLQLSLDGKRLYVTNTLFSSWDKQFYPGLAEKGGQLVRINVDTENGGMSLDETFCVDFGKEPGGPALAHEIRFPEGDSTSDVWY